MRGGAGVGAWFVVCVIALAASAPAAASEVIGRGIRTASLAVDGKGEALVTYESGGKVRRTLVWGAVNALQPRPGGHQVHFQLDYSGGYGKYHTVYWKTFENTCTRYDGPTLPYLVAACKASDGSYWALQSWDAFWPDLGFTPWSASQSYVLTLSHWTGPIAVLDVHVHWIQDGRYRQVFGAYTYDGKPVYGFKTTQFGAPVDSFGRLIYVDTFDAPAYGSGWRRENSFIAHQGSGGFCYGLFKVDPLHGGYAHPPGYRGGLRGPGVGTAYRISGEGPGVTPDVAVTVKDPGSWNPEDDAKMTLESADAKVIAKLHLAGCAAS